MGSDAKKAYGAKREDILLFDPDQLVVVTDKNHPLYDPRVEWPLDEKLIKNMMVNGVLQAIHVRLNGKRADGTPIVEVVDGRRRVLHAREANKRLRAQGLEPLMIRALRHRGEDHEQFGIMVATNEFRLNDSPADRAEKVHRYMKMGRTEEDAAIQFGCDVMTIKNYLAYLECSTKVRKAVKDEKITFTLAVKDLSSLPREKQDETLDKLIKAGATKGSKATAAVKAAKAGRSVERATQQPGERMRTRAFTMKWLDELRAEGARDPFINGARYAIEFLLGGELDVLPQAVRGAAERALKG